MNNKFEKDDVVIYKGHVVTIEYIDEDYEFADVYDISYKTYETVYVRELEKI